MTKFQPLDPEFNNRIHESFQRQSMMGTMGAELALIQPGEVHITAPYDERFTQQDGFLHAGTVTTLIDSACGYAAYSLMPAGSRVLSVEFKVNLLSPAQGESFRAEGSVIKPGKTLTVCEGKLFALNDGQEKLVAVMQATMICVLNEGERT
jgi:uncharacterized protein (TIGR00369 family)